MQQNCYQEASSPIHIKLTRQPAGKWLLASPAVAWSATATELPPRERGSWARLSGGSSVARRLHRRAAPASMTPPLTWCLWRPRPAWRPFTP